MKPVVVKPSISFEQLVKERRAHPLMKPRRGAAGDLDCPLTFSVQFATACGIRASGPHWRTQNHND
jgi:hypothetical protein